MPVDFGINLPSFMPGCEGDVLTCYERWLGALSPHFTTVWLSDHFQFGATPSFEGWTRLTYLAAAFPTFKYGHLVLGQNYRNPASLAKMGATGTSFVRLRGFRDSARKQPLRRHRKRCLSMLPVILFLVLASRGFRSHRSLLWKGEQSEQCPPQLPPHQ